MATLKINALLKLLIRSIEPLLLIAGVTFLQMNFTQVQWLTFLRRISLPSKRRKKLTRCLMGKNFFLCPWCGQQTTCSWLQIRSVKWITTMELVTSGRLDAGVESFSKFRSKGKRRTGALTNLLLTSLSCKDQVTSIANRSNISWLFMRISSPTSMLGWQNVSNLITKNHAKVLALALGTKLSHQNQNTQKSMNGWNVLEWCGPSALSLIWKSTVLAA